MNRRDALKSIGSGFGMMAFAEMLGSTALYAGGKAGWNALRSENQACHFSFPERRALTGGYIRSKACA